MSHLKTHHRNETAWTLGVLLATLVLLVGPARGQDNMVQTAADTLLAVAGEAVDGDLVEESRAQGESLDLAQIDLWDTGVNPTAAVVMTPLFPGWGQLYARNSWQAALGFGVEMYYWTNMLVRDRRAVRANDFGESLEVGDPTRDRYRAIADENWEQMRDFAWWSGGVLLIIALDAYVGAHLFDFDEDPVPVPDRWDDTFGRVGESMPGGAEGPSLVVFQWRKAF